MWPCYLPIRRNPSQVYQMDCVPAATSLAYSRESTGAEGSRNSLTPLPADTGALEKGRKDKPRSLSNFTASYPCLETSPGPFCPKIFIRYFPQLPGHAVLERCGDVEWL